MALDLKAKVGPLPLWAYAALGAGGVGVWWLKKRQAAAAGVSADTSTTDTTGVTAGATDATGGGYTGGYSDGSAGYDNAVSTAQGQELATIGTDLGTINTSIQTIAGKLPGAGTVVTGIAGPGGVPGGKVPGVPTVTPVKKAPVKVTTKAPAKPKYYSTTKVNIPVKAGYGRVFNHSTGKWGYVKLSVLHPAKK